MVFQINTCHPVCVCDFFETCWTWQNLCFGDKCFHHPLHHSVCFDFYGMWVLSLTELRRLLAGAICKSIQHAGHVSWFWWLCSSERKRNRENQDHSLPSTDREGDPWNPTLSWGSFTTWWLLEEAEDRFSSGMHPQMGCRCSKAHSEQSGLSEAEEEYMKLEGERGEGKGEIRGEDVWVDLTQTH